MVELKWWSETISHAAQKPVKRQVRQRKEDGTLLFYVAAGEHRRAPGQPVSDHRQKQKNRSYAHSDGLQKIDHDLAQAHRKSMEPVGSQRDVTLVMALQYPQGLEACCFSRDSGIRRRPSSS